MISENTLYETLLNLPFSISELDSIIDYGVNNTVYDSVYDSLGMTLLSDDAELGNDLIILRDIQIDDATRVIFQKAYDNLKDGSFAIYIFNALNENDVSITNLFVDIGFNVVEKSKQHGTKENVEYRILLQKPIPFVHESASRQLILEEIRQREEDRIFNSSITNEITPPICSKTTRRCSRDYIKTGGKIPRCCHSHLKEMLIYIREIFDANDIKYWIDGEALRDSKLGNLKSNTDRIVIGTLIGDKSKIIKLKGQMVLDGFFLNQKSIQRHKCFSFQYSKLNDISIDIYSWSEKNGLLNSGRGSSTDKSVRSFPSYLITNLDKVTLEGEEFNSPSDIEVMLEFRFGKGQSVTNKHMKFDINRLILPVVEPEELESIPEECKQIWMYWENERRENVVPAIYELCIESVVNNSTGMTINVLNDNNIREYLPDLRADFEEIVKPKHKGDYIRAKLLNDLGGVWIDSDIIIRQQLLLVIEPIKKYDFITAGEYYGKPNVGFFVSRKNSEILSLWIDKMDSILNRTLKNRTKTLFFDEVFWEIANNYMYYNYENKLFEPIDSDFYLVENLSTANEFCNIVEQENKIIGYHLHSKVSKVLRVMSREEILSSSMLVSQILNMEI